MVFCNVVECEFRELHDFIDGQEYVCGRSYTNIDANGECEDMSKDIKKSEEKE